VKLSRSAWLGFGSSRSFFLTTNVYSSHFSEPTHSFIWVHLFLKLHFYPSLLFFITNLFYVLKMVYFTTKYKLILLILYLISILTLQVCHIDFFFKGLFLLFFNSLFYFCVCLVTLI